MQKALAVKAAIPALILFIISMIILFMKHLRLAVAVLLLMTFQVQHTEAQEDSSAKKQRPLVISFSPSNIEYNPLYTFTSTEAQVYTAIYEGLVTYNPLTLEPVPAVAESWDVSSNKKEYIFNLRKNSYYWDGLNVTAEDFRNSWLKMLAPDTGAQYAFLLDIIKGAKEYRTGINEDENSVGVKVLSEYKLKITLKEPAEHFLKILCHHSFVPIHPAFLNKKDWTDMPSAPGNGPYYVYKKTDKKISLLKNVLYWDSPNVEIEAIDLIFTDNAVEATEDFNNGEIDWAAGGFATSLVENKSDIIFNPTFATNYFFFNCKNSPWDSAEARKAFILSSPLEGIRNSNYLYFPADTLVPLIPNYPNIEGYKKQNKEEAEKLMKEHISEENRDIVIKIPDNPESERVAELFKDTWEDFSGGSVTINKSDYNSYYSELTDNNYTLATISWIGDFPDPLTFLQMWTTDSNLNDSGYSNTVFDEEIEKSMTLSGKERYSFLSSAEKRLLDDAAVIPVSNTPSVNLVSRDRLLGWYPNPLDIHPVKYFYYPGNEIHPYLVKK